MHGKRIISEKCEITVNRKIKDTEGTYILRIKNSFIASNFRPGQFVMIKVNEGGLNPLLSRPFSIFNKFNDSEFEILYRVAGKGTEILSKIKEGSLLEITGPLGNGFDLSGVRPGIPDNGLSRVSSGNLRGGGLSCGSPASDEFFCKTHVLIAGGIGIAPLYSIPLNFKYEAKYDAKSGEKGATEGSEEIFLGENEAVKNKNDKTILYYGAKKAEELYLRHSIHSRFDEVYFATDDGSFGFKGNIIELLCENIGLYKNAYFYACGPKPMFSSLMSRFSDFGLLGRLQASLEENFGCGIGVCLGCVVKTNSRIKSGAGGANKQGGNEDGEHICCNDSDGGNEGSFYFNGNDFEYKRACKDGPVFYADDILAENFDVNSSGVEIFERKQESEKTQTQSERKEKTFNADLSVILGNLRLDYPIMPASGTFGYGEEFLEIIDYNYFGAIVSKGISLKPSKGNEMQRICETACGMINSIGLQNVGFEKFKDEKMPFLRNLNKPVIVNFFGNSVEEYVLLAEKLAVIDGVSALEANISCPNVKEGGRTFGSDPEIVYELVSSVKEKIGSKKTLIVKLTPMVTDISLIAEVCEKAGADIISLINTIPAASIDIKAKKFKLSKGFGGLSGPAVKPIALKLVSDVYKTVRIPVIGMGGISSWEDAVEFFLAGASAISVGTYSFVNPNIISDIVAGIKNYLGENGFKNIHNIIGLANNI